LKSLVIFDETSGKSIPLHGILTQQANIPVLELPVNTIRGNRPSLAHGLREAPTEQSVVGLTCAFIILTP